MNLEEEAKELESLLKDKVVAQIRRYRKEEILIEFTDGTRLFVDGLKGGAGCLDLSVTMGSLGPDE